MSINQDEDLLQPGAGKKITAELILSQHQRKLFCHVNEIMHFLFTQMCKVYFNRWIAVKTAGEIALGAAQRWQQCFPDVDHNAVVQVGRLQLGAVKFVGTDADQVACFQLFAVAFREEIQPPVQKEKKLVAIVVMEAFCR